MSASDEPREGVERSQFEDDMEPDLPVLQRPSDEQRGDFPRHQHPNDEPRAVRCERCDQFQCACPDVVTVPQGMGPILAAVLAEVAIWQSGKRPAEPNYATLEWFVYDAAHQIVRALRLSKEASDG